MHTRRVVLPLILAFSTLQIFAQQTIVATGTIDAAAIEKISPRLISFTDTIDGQPDGALTVSFAIYDGQQATTALWTETQIVQITSGKYTALLGSTSAEGLPEAIFAADQAHWLSVQANGAEKRLLMVAVPYAMKALEAERFGGLLPSQYVTLAELQTILQNSATSTSGSGSGGKPTSPTQTAATTGTAPQPATDFTDNNATEVLLVTQQGTGYAVHSISAGDAALFAESSNTAGTALKSVATASTGNTIGILGQASSPTGIAAVFDSLGGGEILSLRSNGTEMAGVDNLGNVKAAQITAQNFVGNGFGLTNIGPNAVNAQSGNFPDAIVIRDGTGSFAAGQITAQNFVGNGFGLTNIGPNAVNAQTSNIGNTIVIRDGTGSFAAGQITAQNFIGNGFGLTNIGPSAVNAQPGNIANTIVIRDGNGDFAAGQITAQNFIGNGYGLTNISPTAVNAQPGNIGNTIVIRDFNGDFAAGQISAQNFIGNGFGLTNISPLAVGAQPGNIGNTIVIRDFNGDFAAGQISAQNFIGNGFGLTNISPTAVNAQSGNVANTIVVRDSSGNFAAGQIGASGLTVSGNADFTAANTTAPVKAVLSTNTPTTCQTSKELLIKTDAPAGQQLFICNATGDGYVLVGDGTGPAGSGLTVNAGTGLSGGGLVSLGSSVTLNNAGVLSFNGRTGNIFSGSGDYSFAQLAGTATASQLPADVAYNDRSNTFSTDQTIQGNLTTTGNITASGSVTANSLSINDSGPANGFGPLFVVSQNNPAASLTSLGPIVFSAGNAVRGLMILDSSGNLNLGGAVTATTYNGDGSGLTNVNASKIGTLAPADIASASALAAEATTRQTADDNLQASLGQEALARQSDEATLFSSISAETTARQSDVANLQTNINNVSAADAKLAASNTFTAGTQDFSGAGATLPVRSVLSANTPAICVAAKELLIKTDATPGQQLFICDSTGTAWNVVGDGASGGVTSFNGRAGSVTPAANDYSFAQISGSAAVAQLPSIVVYNNQANTLAGNQTVNGSVTATAFSGSGAGLSNVNAATLNGIPSSAFAQLNTINTFTAEQVLPASTAVNPSLNMPSGPAPSVPLAGDIWNNSGVIQYRDNASATRSLVSTTQNGGLQLLKLIAQITPSTVGIQSCTEQNFNVPGVTTGDLLLAVLQPGNSSPGTNIAIGGWRISANNTVAIQFCNVSRNSSTPVSGPYTFALMR